MSSLQKTIVLIGLMGSGKSRIGIELARLTNLPFIDVDKEIEKSAGLSIAEIFDRFGEAYFREGEKKVMRRLLNGETAILASGGGAFMNEETRSFIKESAISIWLKADIKTLVERTSRGQHRPLLRNGDKEGILTELMEHRYPVYAAADITVNTDDLAPGVVARHIKDILYSRIKSVS